MKNLVLFVILCTAVAGSFSGRALAKPRSSDSQPDSDARIKLLTYDESDVYVIRTKFGYQTNIVFAPHEEIQTISVGDRSLWQLIPTGNRLFIRPMTENITTNMTLLTNKRSYEFDLKSVDEKNESNIYVAKFIYPSKSESALSEVPVAVPSMAMPPAMQIPIVNTAKAPQVMAAPAASPAPVSLSSANKQKPEIAKSHDNYNYTYSGADALAPNMVYDNGKSTFINYQAMKTPLPEVFIVAGGKEFLVTPTVQGNNLVVNDIAGEMVLRSVDGEIRIYNESLSAR